MPRSRKITPEREALITQLLESYQPGDVNDIQSMLKDLSSDTLQGMLESELDDDLDIPRDRNGDFEPQIIKKHQTDISTIEDQVLSMYAKGMTTRDITSHLYDVYGIDASPTMISKMTDKILPVAKEWQSRPLASKYAIVFMDAIYYNVRQDNAIVKKAVCITIGIKLSGSKDA